MGNEWQWGHFKRSSIHSGLMTLRDTLHERDTVAPMLQSLRAKVQHPFALEKGFTLIELYSRNES